LKKSIYLFLASSFFFVSLTFVSFFYDKEKIINLNIQNDMIFGSALSSDQPSQPLLLSNCKQQLFFEKYLILYYLLLIEKNAEVQTEVKAYLHRDKEYVFCHQASQLWLSNQKNFFSYYTRKISVLNYYQRFFTTFFKNFNNIFNNIHLMANNRDLNQVINDYIVRSPKPFFGQDTLFYVMAKSIDSVINDAFQGANSTKLARKIYYFLRPNFFSIPSDISDIVNLFNNLFVKEIEFLPNVMVWLITILLDSNNYPFLEFNNFYYLLTDFFFDKKKNIEASTEKLTNFILDKLSWLIRKLLSDFSTIESI
jgi:hypothetical protein